MPVYLSFSFRKQFSRLASLGATFFSQSDASREQREREREKHFRKPLCPGSHSASASRYNQTLGSYD